MSGDELAELDPQIGAACGSSLVWGTVRLEPLYRTMTCRRIHACRISGFGAAVDQCLRNEMETLSL